MSINSDDSTNIEDEALFDEELLEDYNLGDDSETSPIKDETNDTVSDIENCNAPDKHDVKNVLNHSLNASETKAVELSEQNTEIPETVENSQLGTRPKKDRPVRRWIKHQLSLKLKYGKPTKYDALLRSKKYSDLVEECRQELKMKLEKKGLDFNKIANLCTSKMETTSTVQRTPTVQTTPTVLTTATAQKNFMKEQFEKKSITGKEQKNMQGNESGIESETKAFEPSEQSADTEIPQTEVNAQLGKKRKRAGPGQHSKKWIKYQLTLQLKYGISPKCDSIPKTKQYADLVEQCRKELKMKTENTGQKMANEPKQEMEKSTPPSVQSSPTVKTPLTEQITPTTPSTAKVKTTPTVPTTPIVQTTPKEQKPATAQKSPGKNLMKKQFQKESITGKKHQSMQGRAVKFYEDVLDDIQIKEAERENSLAYSDVPKTSKKAEIPATQGTTAKPISENKTKYSAKTRTAVNLTAITTNTSHGLPSGVPRNFLMKQVNMTSIEPQDPNADACKNLPKNQMNKPPIPPIIPNANKTPNISSNPNLISITGESAPNVDKGVYLQQMANRLFNRKHIPHPVNHPFPQMHEEQSPPAQYYPMMNQYPPEMPPTQPFPPLNYAQNPNPHSYQTPPAMFGQPYTQHYPMPVAPVAPPNIPNPILFQTPSTQQQNLAQHLPLQVETAPVAQSSSSPNYQPQERQLMYSPSDAYAESKKENSAEKESREDTESPDSIIQVGQKRLSAFQRLGPLTETKKPKLTINLLLKKETAVREVLDADGNSLKDAYVPVHLRPEIVNSKNPVVMKFLSSWPWKKNFAPKRISSARLSKSAMIVELEQMEEIYLKDNLYFQITVKGYPTTWTKENVLDAILNAVKGKSFIPCFIEFKKEECIFLVIKSYTALVALHKMFFVIPSKETELQISIGHLMLNTNHLNLIPKLVIESIIMAGYDNESTLNLKAFTLEEDVSHFVYFPLCRLANQVEMMQLGRNISWVYITDLDLSSNRLTTIDGLDLTHNCPKLKHLDLSDNWFTRISALLGIRSLALRSIKLEGNPLCHDYTDPDHYVAVLRTAFSTLRKIDGVPIKLSGDLPTFTRTYCPAEAEPVVDKFLSVYFPLIDSAPADRNLMENLYDEDAVLTITYRDKLRSQAVYRNFRNLFVRARVLAAGDVESVCGAAAVARHHARSPPARHDPAAFTHDVLLHSEHVLVLKVTGVLKLTAETLAEDEHLIAFSRTFVLKTNDGVMYKIVNEMLYWDEPTPEYANNAFKVTTLKSKPISLKLEGTPDDDLKEKLVELFMKLTNLKKGPSYRCLEMKEWNFKLALQLFFKLLKLDNLSSLLSENDSSLPLKK